jgi:hypothetical protein
MKKLMIGEKEIDVDEKTIRQLSDDELEDACGGSGTGGKSYFRLVCDQCNFKSWWNPKKAEEIYLVDFHKQVGCNGILKYEIQCFESDPNLVTG